MIGRNLIKTAVEGAKNLSFYQKLVLFLLVLSTLVSLKGAYDAQEANYYSSYAYDYAMSASGSASRAAEYAERSYEILD